MTTKPQNKQKDNISLPYETILAASTGDIDAITALLRHFDPYLNRLSRRTRYDANGQIVPYRDPEIKRWLEVKLILKALRFKAKGA